MILYSVNNLCMKRSFTVWTFLLCHVVAQNLPDLWAIQMSVLDWESSAHVPNSTTVRHASRHYDCDLTSSNLGQVLAHSSRGYMGRKKARWCECAVLAGVWGFLLTSWLSEKQRQANAGIQMTFSLFCLYSDQGPSPWDSSTYPQGVFPFQWTLGKWHQVSALDIS